MSHARSRRTSTGQQRQKQHAWASLAGGLALIVGLTTSALGAAVVLSGPAGAVTHAHVQRSASDLLQPRAFIPFTTVHVTFNVTDFGDDNANPANCTTPSASCTLRGAVAAANADTGNLDGIVIPSGNTVMLTGGVIDLTNSVLINAAGATVNGGGNQIFNEDTATITVQITGGTLTNGNAGSGSGGAFEQDSGALLFNGVTFASNTADAGGALYSDAQLWISNSAFSGNTGTGTSADSSGGGIYFDSSSSAFIENTLFQGNGAPYGGGFDNYDGAVTVNDSTFTANNQGPTTTAGNGGGMYTDELAVGTNDTFDNNSFNDGGNGAGVENEYNLGLSNSHIDNNTCSGGDVSGCGLYEDGDGSTYTNVTVNGSNANAGTGAVEGGAIYTDPDTGRFDGLTVNGTNATGQSVDGGAIYAQYSTFTNVSVSSTSAHGSDTGGGYVDGGAIYSNNDSSYTNVAITGTTATADLATASTPSTTKSEVYGGAFDNESEANINSMNVTNTTTTASGGNGQVVGGVFYSDSLLNATNLNATGATVSADSYVEGGLLVNYDHFNATNVTFGSATVNVPGSTAEANPEADGSVIYSDDSLNAINMTANDVNATVGSGTGFNYGVEIDTGSGNAFTNSTIANNNLSGPSGSTFGLFVNSGDSVALLNTIVSMSAPCGFGSGGKIDSLGHNLDNSSTCGMTAPGDIENANPQVQPLANNGGQVLTGALVKTSPAIDAGTNVNCPKTDARGVPRPQAGTCDIGAFEYVHMGYWMAGNDGGVFNYGDAQFEGSMGGQHLNAPIVGIAGTGDVGAGYWLAASDGGVFSFGNANFHGSAGNIHLNKPIVGIAAKADAGGYWLVATDGGVFNYGDAGFFGSAGNIHLNKPIVGMAATPDGGGYWLVASDGGIFTYGDAVFHGSAGNIHLNKPVVGMAATPDGGGYWLVATDGGIFSYGDAAFFGSTGAITLNQPINGMASGPLGQGYWLFAADGGVFSFGDSMFLGSVPGSGAHVTNIIGGAST